MAGAQMRRFCGGAVVCAVFPLIGCSQMTDSHGQRKAGPTQMRIEKEPFGQTPDGEALSMFKLTNANGMYAEITNYGATVTRLLTPDRNGMLDDVVLGYDTAAEYIKASPYFGCIVGRYGNRIADGRFKLDGVEYRLATNNNANHLHGGLKGFDKRVWAAEPFKDASAVGVRLTYTSKDGEEGYPGNLACEVIYSLTNRNELAIEYTAFTDKPTPVNLTHHGYWNLAGQGTRDILGHELMLNAEAFTPVDSGLIPTGELRPVQGTPMDFTMPMPIGARVNAEDEQIRYGKGYDHNWVLKKSRPGELSLAASVYEPTTGRVMEVLTTEPGIQFYCGNFLDGSNVGKGGRVYQHRYGFCLETQHFPDSPNKPQFPSAILRPGQTYTHKTIYRFSAK